MPYVLGRHPGIAAVIRLIVHDRAWRWSSLIPRTNRAANTVFPLLKGSGHFEACGYP